MEHSDPKMYVAELIEDLPEELEISLLKYIFDYYEQLRQKLFTNAIILESGQIHLNLYTQEELDNLKDLLILKILKKNKYTN